MRRIIVAVFAVLVLASVAQAIEVNLGGFFGIRTVNDAAIKGIYGNGMVIYPYLGLILKNGLGIGVSYEFYDRSGTVQPYDESTRLKISGPEVYLSYSLKLKHIRPYIRAGYGSYSYNQEIVSDYVAGYSVNAKKSAPHFAAGSTFLLFKTVYVAVEAKYVPLKVRPIEDEVDLGGWRFGGGIGVSFGK